MRALQRAEQLRKAIQGPCQEHVRINTDAGQHLDGFRYMSDVSARADDCLAVGDNAIAVETDRLARASQSGECACWRQLGQGRREIRLSASIENRV